LESETGSRFFINNVLLNQSAQFNVKVKHFQSKND